LPFRRRERRSLAALIFLALWRVVRVFLVAFAAMGPGPPPQPPPPRPQIELREEKAQKRSER
jgi:hypothetical protein